MTLLKLTLPAPYYYQLHVPESLPAPLLVCLHGYGQNVTHAMKWAKAVRQDWVIAALQAPHPHHIFPEDRSQPLGTGFSWVSSFEPTPDVENHHLFIKHLADTLYRQGLSDQPQAFVMGFSQPVSLNFRFAAAHPECVRGVIAVAGAVPSDWQLHDPSPRLSAPVLYICPEEDEAYAAQMPRFQELLGHHCHELVWETFPGRHRIPRASMPVMHRWLDQHQH